jgi:hypothetical protein
MRDQFYLTIFLALFLSTTITAQHAPIITDVPDNLILTCADDLPVAIDPTVIYDTGCALVSVEVIDTEICAAYEEYEVSMPTFLDPANEFGLFLANLPGGLTDKYMWDDAQSVLFASDEHVYMLGEVFSPIDPTVRFEVFHAFDQGLDWDQWSNLLTTPMPATYRSYKDDSGLAVAGGNLYEDWQYYLMDASSSYIYGLESREGDALTVSHAPPNLLYGFQMGQAANTVDDGFGCNVWGLIDGAVEGAPTSSVHTMNSTLNLAGTVGSLYCSDVVIRTYKVTDSCGNISQKSQVIRFTGGNFPGDMNGDGIVDVTDFLSINTAWGASCAGCPEDIDGNGIVDISDFLAFNSLLSGVCN